MARAPRVCSARGKAVEHMVTILAEWVKGQRRGWLALLVGQVQGSTFECPDDRPFCRRKTADPRRQQEDPPFPLLLDVQQCSHEGKFTQYVWKSFLPGSSIVAL